MGDPTMTIQEAADAVVEAAGKWADADYGDSKEFGADAELNDAVRAYRALSAPPADDSDDLGAAWKDVEAALPKKWLGPVIEPYFPSGWEARAHHQDAVPGTGRGPRASGAHFGATPALALRALAVALRRVSKP